MRVLGFLGSGLLLVALPVYAGQSEPGQAAPAQPDTAVLLQKIRDLEDRVIAMEGQIRQLKSGQTPPAQPPPSAASSAESGTAVPPQTLSPAAAAPAREPGAWTVVLGG